MNVNICLNHWKHYKLLLRYSNIPSVFQLRATSPCLLSEVQLCWLVLSVGCYLGAPLNLGTVWATWALSAASSQWRIHGRRAFAGPASTSPWFSSPSFLALPILTFSPDSASVFFCLCADDIQTRMETSASLLWHTQVWGSGTQRTSAVPRRGGTVNGVHVSWYFSSVYLQICCISQKKLLSEVWYALATE